MLVSGWGANVYEGYGSDVLKAGFIYGVSNQKCSSAYGKKQPGEVFYWLNKNSSTNGTLTLQQKSK